MRHTMIAACMALAAAGAPALGAPAGIPVILDTDIGSDIDDTWALAFLLRCPEIDLKLVVSDTGNTTYRARIAAKLLQVAGRTDVPVGVGVHRGDAAGPQAPWVEGYELEDYPGKVYRDGVDALIRTITASEEPITLLCIGPVTNIAEALRREPRIATRARFVGMHGSVYRGYNGSEKVSAEYNVKHDAKACQAAFTAAWPMTITPLDTCGIVRLQGERYRAVRESANPLARAVVENYRHWLRGKPDVGSSVLFDPVAVYLAFSEALVEMKDVGLRVTDDGFTVPDEGAKRVRCALAWKGLPAFQDLLVRRLTDGKP